MTHATAPESCFCPQADNVQGISVGWSKNPNFIQLALHNPNFILSLTTNVSAKFYCDW